MEFPTFFRAHRKNPRPSYNQQVKTAQQTIDHQCGRCPTWGLLSSKSNIFSQIHIMFYLGVVATSFSCPPLPTGPALQGPNTPGDHRDLQRLLNRGERVLLRPTSQILQHNPQLLQNWKTSPCRRNVCPCLWWGWVHSEKNRALACEEKKERRFLWNRTVSPVYI